MRVTRDFFAARAAGWDERFPDDGPAFAAAVEALRPPLGGTLGLFHPVGRTTLAARHGHAPDPDDPRAEPVIRALLAESGWRAEQVDDGDERYLVVAVRCQS